MEKLVSLYLQPCARLSFSDVSGSLMFVSFVVVFSRNVLEIGILN